MDEASYPREIQFTLAGSPLKAWAHRVDSIHSNVLRVTLIRSKFAGCFAAALDLLPRFIRRLFQGLPARFRLPSQLILKTIKPKWDEEFENEKAMYKRLEPLQGLTMPRFLGDAEFNKRPSILLTYIDGVPSYKQGPTPLPAEEFERQVEAILWGFTNFGVVYDDTKMDNFLVRSGKVMVVDLESVGEVEEDKFELAVTSHLSHMMMFYAIYLKNLSDPDAWD